MSCLEELLLFQLSLLWAGSLAVLLFRFWIVEALKSSVVLLDIDCYSSLCFVDMNIGVYLLPPDSGLHSIYCSYKLYMAYYVSFGLCVV